ncbi:hypothetical protein GGX14DRAFT_553557 [Mycena pura]|uniref:Uncharacterized protein n=1 Tax=Mycena pura TaxID=153505 RepID=A0AAD6YVB0_9AGAR|nr:hypothetical protein GGX14DRAFT_553557 [Mycena pura]
MEVLHVNHIFREDVDARVQFLVLGHVPLVYHVINIDNSDSESDAAIADTDTISLTALQESLEPADPAPRSFPSRLFNMGMSGHSGVDLLL